MSHRRTALIASLTAAVAFCAARAAAQEAEADQPAPAPAAQQAPEQDDDPPQGQALKVTIVQVRGKNKAQVRQSENQPWQWAAVGMELQIGAEVRTQFGGGLVLSIEGGHTVTVGRSSSLKILNAVKGVDGVIHTDVGLEKGRTRYDIDEAGAGHDSKVRTPGSTMALRGTRTEAGFDHYTDFARSFDQPVDVESKTFKRNIENVADGTVTSRHLEPAQTLMDGQFNSALTGFDGKTLVEIALAEQYPGGVNQSQDGTLRGLTTHSKDSSSTGGGGLPSGLFMTIPDTFMISASWNTTPPGFDGDYDVIVIDPFGAVLDPKGMTIVRQGLPTMGVHSGDDAGLGGGGFEITTYGPMTPAGAYELTVRKAGGADANVTVEAGLGDSSFFLTSTTISDSQPQRRFIINPGTMTGAPVP